VIGWPDAPPGLFGLGLFKWRQFEPEVILLAVGWYLCFSLSYRDVEELLAERGLRADHVTVWRWVQRYARKWNNVCVGDSNQPTTVGGWMRPTWLNSNKGNKSDIEIVPAERALDIFSSCFFEPVVQRSAQSCGSRAIGPAKAGAFAYDAIT
jgi:hypothetical protein